MNRPSARPEPSRLGSRAQPKTHKSPAQPDRSEARLLNAALDQPQRATAAGILQLQRTAGNRAVQGLLARSGIQAQLTVGPANDAYEREADRVARAVVHSSASSVRSARGLSGADDALQRQP